MNINTHQDINTELCGTPLYIGDDTSCVELRTLESMSVDDYGLVHGGFIFGLADHAAMIAVNDPNVVLGSADVKFMKPVVAGEIVRAYAEVTHRDGRKHIVTVTVKRENDTVFRGDFTCFVMAGHVLAQ